MLLNKALPTASLFLRKAFEDLQFLFALENGGRFELVAPLACCFGRGDVLVDAHQVEFTGNVRGFYDFDLLALPVEADGYAVVCGLVDCNVF